MARSKTSKRWLDEHFHDEFVHMAKAQGLRSRAAFKLLEIQQKDKLIKPGMIVIDLGAAPGGWSQVASQLVGDKGKVIALDRLAMPSLAGVDFIQGDFTEDAVLAQLLSHMGDHKADIIISDMAPNTSGVESVDIPASMYLCELALVLADDVLKPGGNLLMKVFQGAGIEELRRDIKEKFQKLITRKPKASRSRSKEAYLLATGYNL